MSKYTDTDQIVLSHDKKLVNLFIAIDELLTFSGCHRSDEISFERKEFQTNL
jgi:hypothetical protein